MKFLHSWLQEYIEEKIPRREEFVKGISENAFEVEEYFEIENKINKEKDFVYDLNVLPNRNHDAISHYYMAKEVAVIFNLRLKELNLEKDFIIKKTADDIIKISDGQACTRFMGCQVKNLKVKESPDFIKYRLEAIGQKSINNIVDITNYVQFAFNKPMHAYDADLVSGFLEARFAKENESMTTLDNKELVLDTSTLVIADEKNVLALAGIKGGKYSGISEDTHRVIIESANFDPVLIRKTSQRYNLKTDASKRFENEISDTLVEIGMFETLRLLKEYASDGNIEIGEIVDNFPKERLSKWVYKISVSLSEVNKVLGTSLDVSEVEGIFKRFGFEYKYLSTKENLEDLAKKVLGKKYKNPSSMREDAPEAFSCSSLVSYLYEGIYMPSLSVDKYLFTKELGKEIKSESDLKFGDLLFRNSEKGKIYYAGVQYKKGEEVKEGIDHVGMYVGDNKILHSSKNLKEGTEMEALEDFMAGGKFVGYGRVLEDLEEKRFVISVPNERLDLRIKEDIVEEVARAYGLNNIKGIVPNLNRAGIQDKRNYYENLVKNILFRNGFSEVVTYSLRGKGEIEILKSVAQDKNYLRNNLREGVQESVQKNIFNLPLLNVSEIRIFEFGNCFSLNSEGKEKEWTGLCLAVDDGKKNKSYSEFRNKILEEIKNELNVSEIKFEEFKNERQKENCLEINFSEMIQGLEYPAKYQEINEKVVDREVKYKPFALTPFIVRDIACWTSEATEENDIEKIIQENISPLCISVNLFDKFEKEIDGVKKKSFAYRLIYQDKERTLTDEEVNLEADKVYNALRSEGFEIR
ncbi:MAG: phenylalanine--tRNA ligase beta subunit-related protein [Candidatus Pacebacteria bacterium]|nr:phenylalanine--tRNA ligase beta subunit-related protein [Candidatus Paceibacterota bacterium]